MTETQWLALTTRHSQSSFLSIEFLLLLPSAMKLRRLCFCRRLSVHRGVGWGCLPQCMLGYHLPPPRADTPREQTPPRADTLPEQTTPRSRHLPPRYGHCCGRYASYWNAFLCILKFKFNLIQLIKLIR